MIRIAVIIFRESVEIAILLSILIAVTKTINNSRLYIIAGVVLGVVGASLFAFFAKTISLSLSGIGDEIFDSIVIMLTVLVISFTVVWMQDCAKKLKMTFNHLSTQVNCGTVSRFVLTSVASTIIFREGVEIILYVYSIASLDAVDLNDYLIGFSLGAASGIFLGILIYLGLVKFAGRYIFTISSFLLILIASGLASEAAGLLTSSGIIEIYSEELWDTSWLIDNRSATGRILEAFVGYTAKPNGMQIIFYFSTLFFIFCLIQIRNSWNKNITTS